jgi:hypothetical protein
LTVRLKYMQNAVDGGGTLARGELAHVGIYDLLGGNAGHRMWESSTTKRYTLGARLILPDGRVYRYAKAGGTLIPGQGAKNYEEEYIRYAVLPAAVAAGAKSLSLTVNAHDSSRDLHDGTLAANELEGGYVVIFDKTATNQVVLRNIKTNTAVASGGGTTVITIDEQVPLALIVTDAGAAMCSPYLNVQSLSATPSDTTPVVGVPTVPAVVGEYLWIQTWGICWIASHAEVGTGDNVHEAFFNGDGSLGVHGDGVSLQHAGFMMSSRARGGAQGETFIMLQISI